ncbi:succinate--CoA ligase [GDP-forming] subunit beta, mitochondrial-like [Saccostrea echinata]|uniref:succinate--CoA ligase [GDP-forming] subunit beta, mitochondrial-like n=1 Tax=Saccostrea echinata TaxID=191078 RepID=UPI002A821856|nr:succinate--CoA ligase [GDP-forming] subunit beta, mitochondrial-like [Saccostrea echinata]
MSAPMNMLRTYRRLSNLSSILQNFKKEKKNVFCVSIRCLSLQEYQSKKLMLDNGINVQKFVVCSSAEEAKTAAKKLEVDEYVIKAQILAGGRGKGVFSNGFKGGVHLTKNPGEVEGLVTSMLGHKLKTKQTTGDGVKVSKVMVAEALDLARETYFAIVLDRSFAGPVIIGSKHGGMDIEETAATDPGSIIKEPVDIMTSVTERQCLSVAEKLGFQGSNLQTAADQIRRLYELFVKVDATQVEINPFGETPDGRVVCFDAKINFDDNAAFRQKEVFAMDDMAETDPREIEASRLKLNYIALEGSIGCLVNGAGLAMATMDIIKLHGGEPANFLDVGGGVSEQQVHDAFFLLMGDSHVKTILVNIFGGIVNCATVATGIIKASKKLHLELPLVVRLEGNNVEEAKKILAESGMKITVADGFNDAARLSVESAASA